MSGEGTVRQRGAPSTIGGSPTSFAVCPTTDHAIDLWMLNVNEFPVVGQELFRPRWQNLPYGIYLVLRNSTFPSGSSPRMDRVDEIWVARHASSKPASEG